MLLEAPSKPAVAGDIRPLPLLCVTAPPPRKLCTRAALLSLIRCPLAPLARVRKNQKFLCWETDTSGDLNYFRLIVCNALSFSLQNSLIEKK